MTYSTTSPDFGCIGAEPSSSPSASEREHQRDQMITVHQHQPMHTSCKSAANGNCQSLNDSDRSDSSSSSYYSSSSSSYSSLPSLPQEAEELNKSSTANCMLMEHTKIPLTVKTIGWMAFYHFTSLVQVNCMHSQLREISSCAFMECRSLQLVALPDSLERISYGAFGSCVNLVTVAMSPTAAIRIKTFSFRKCESLSNIVISPKSVIDQRAFEGCSRLQECLGSLMGRFEGLPVHKLCYQASTTSVTELKMAMNTKISIDEMEQLPPLVDMFEMTPFHVLCSSAEPRLDLFLALLQQYPHHALGWKDANAKRAMDYLATNFTQETASLLELALQTCMLGPLERWGATKWLLNMKDQINTLLATNDRKKRVNLLQNVSVQMDDYRRREVMTSLELSVWKKELTVEHDKNDHVARTTALHVCGSCCVLSNVAPFLGITALADTFRATSGDDGYDLLGSL